MNEGVVRAYLAAWLGPRSRRDIERRQQRLWCALQVRFRASPALAPYARATFNDIPVSDIASFRARFDTCNTRGLTREAANRAAEAAERGEAGDLPAGLRAGFSTGTGGGVRGLFVTAPDERSTYTGRILGKLIRPWELPGLTRIALCLRARSELYQGVRVRFFELDDSDRAVAITAYDPQVLIAPPHVLLELAASGRALPSLKYLYYGAETLNEVGRAFITARLGRRPDPIYQATEGFLAAPCRFGTLHLNEDGLIIEREALGGDRFRPIVTDLLRRTQMVVRLRLDDILRPTTCACGSALAAVHPVEGRVQDMWRWPGQTVFPGEVEAQVAPCLPADHAWIATGHAGGVRFACAHEEDAPALAESLAVFGQPVTREPYVSGMDYPKRRHVRWVA